MKVIDVAPAMPEAIRCFLDPRIQERPDYLQQLSQALLREKQEQFRNVNRYLDGPVAPAGHLVEELHRFQHRQEESRELDPVNQEAHEDLKERSQAMLVELHRAKVKLSDLKIVVCRFIVRLESPNKENTRALRNLEEWQDAATMAEMRLSRHLERNPKPSLQQFLSLYVTFRSVICSYDGPSQSIRSVEAATASLEALHEKVRLENEVLSAQARLAEREAELKTAKMDLRDLKTAAPIPQGPRGEIQLVEKSPWPRLLAIGGVIALCVAAVAVFVLRDHGRQDRAVEGVHYQKACQDIADRLAESPRAASQVLSFRKFGADVYFRANAETCTKLHRLDSTQVLALVDLLRADYEAGSQDRQTFNGRRVLQPKAVGQDKLVIPLVNATSGAVEFKLQVLEAATLLRAVLRPGQDGSYHVIVDLERGRAQNP